MAGIAMPKDRTVKQPATGFCRNKHCRIDGKEFQFPVEHDRFACPKCGADSKPMVGVLVLTHLLLPHEQGPLKGRSGRWVIACDDQRAYLATATNQEAATDNAEVANCPGCLAKAIALGAVKVNGWQFDPSA